MNEIKSKAHNLKPSVWVGKNRINSSVIEEIKKQAKKKGIVKVRFLKSFADNNSKKEAVNELSKKTGLIVISSVGNVVVLAKT